MPLAVEMAAAAVVVVDMPGFVQNHRKRVQQAPEERTGLPLEILVLLPEFEEHIGLRFLRERLALVALLVLALRLRGSLHRHSTQ
jgi:hypothetical protein